LFFTETVVTRAAVAADPPGPVGQLPKGADGKPLNLDFEKGTLDDWTAAGEAFAGQPIEGDTPTARGRGMASHHRGEYWIGGFEKTKSDDPQGTLTSAPFKVIKIFASFRIAGGSSSWCGRTRER
jgi:hypothetical protein